MAATPEDLFQPQSGAVPMTPTGAPAAPEDEMERLRAYLDTLSPEDQEAFLDSMFADYEGEEGQVDRQRALADELRGTEAEGRKYGGVYTAANPLEHLGAGMGRIQGQMKGRAAEEAMGGITDQRAQAQRQMAEALMRR